VEVVMQNGLRASIELAPRYVRGFPMLATTTLFNESAGSTYRNLSRETWLASECALHVRWRRAGEIIEHEPEGCDSHEGPADGWLSRPASALGSVFDLSLDAIDLPAGEWELEIEHHVGRAHVSSPTARVTIVEPEGEVASAAAMLRSANDLERDRWHAFVLAHRGPIDAELLEKLSSHQRELALHLFVQAAIHGDRELAELDDSPLLEIEGPAETEAALVRHELLCIRKAPHAAGIGHAICERWPGFCDRVRASGEGKGQLARLRAFYR
jgi:hypothetical protein